MTRVLEGLEKPGDEQCGRPVTDETEPGTIINQEAASQGGPSCGEQRFDGHVCSDLFRFTSTNPKEQLETVENLHLRWQNVSDVCSSATGGRRKGRS